MKKFRKLMIKSFPALLYGAATFFVAACLTNISGVAVPLILPLIVMAVLLFWEVTLVVTLVI